VTEDEEQEQQQQIAGCSRNLHLPQIAKLATGAFLFTLLLHFLLCSLSLSLSLANLPASSIAQCTQTLHQQMHKAKLRTCTTTHTTKKKKRI
jgi:hypothetical protein